MGSQGRVRGRVSKGMIGDPRFRDKSGEGVHEAPESGSAAEWTVKRVTEDTVYQSHHQPMPTAETAPQSVPRDLPLDHQGCTQDGKLLYLHPITWTPGVLKQVSGPLGRCGEEFSRLYLGGNLRGTQGTPDKNLLAMQAILVRSLGCEDPLEKGRATHFSILVWRIPWNV